MLTRKALYLFTTLVASVSLHAGSAESANAQEAEKMTTPPHQYTGMWVTADGYIRHQLLANGRYTEQRGNRKNAYQGDYRITGNHIEYRDDTGFTADGDFIDGVLHHAGMILYRKEPEIQHR
ncbi:Atu4866 domain-containing protein [Chromatiaceae bacterium AAb-1]|nr:Atu4866 domain-containing protein [Chromatiaceae bacterium AAb-1]